MLRNKNTRVIDKSRIKAKAKNAKKVRSLEHIALNTLADIALIELLKKYHTGKVSEK